MIRHLHLSWATVLRRAAVVVIDIVWWGRTNEGTRDVVKDTARRDPVLPRQAMRNDRSGSLKGVASTDTHLVDDENGW